MKHLWTAFCQHPVTRYIAAIPLGVLAFFGATLGCSVLVFFILHSGAEDGKVFWFVPVTPAVHWISGIAQGIACPYFAITVATRVAPQWKLRFGTAMGAMVLAMMFYAVYLATNTWHRMEVVDKLQSIAYGIAWTIGLGYGLFSSLQLAVASKPEWWDAERDLREIEAFTQEIDRRADEEHAARLALNESTHD